MNKCVKERLPWFYGKLQRGRNWHWAVYLLVSLCRVCETELSSIPCHCALCVRLRRPLSRVIVLCVWDWAVHHPMSLCCVWDWVVHHPMLLYYVCETLPGVIVLCVLVVVLHCSISSRRWSLLMRRKSCSVIMNSHSDNLRFWLRSWQHAYYMSFLFVMSICHAYHHSTCTVGISVTYCHKQIFYYMDKLMKHVCIIWACKCYILMCVSTQWTINKRDILFLTITLANLNRFLSFI